MRRFQSLPAVLVLAPSLLAQEPDAPPVFTSRAELVVVDVLVTDGSGEPVRGLSPDDFVVTEDGTPRPIVSFEAIDLPAASSPAAVEAAAVGADVATVTVVFDEQHLSPTSVEQVRRRLDRAWPAMGACDVRFVSTASAATWRGLLPGDAAGLQKALARFKGTRMPERAGKVTDYEAYMVAVRHDDQVLLEVYRRYADQGLIIDPTVQLSPDSLDPQDADRARLDRLLRKQALPPIGQAMVRGEAEQRWSVAHRRQAATHASLIRLIAALGEQRGRKAVILVSEGFVYDPTALEHRSLVEAARRARVTLHVIDPRNPGAFGHDVEWGDVVDRHDVLDTADRESHEAEGSDALAYDTGGRITRSLRNLPDALGRIAGGLRAYYLLGFAPPRTLDGQYHTLTVELKRPGLKVEARPGYYAVAAPAPGASPSPGPARD